MADNSGKTVAEILRGKRGTIKDAPLPKGSPSWDDILHLTWEEVEERATRRERGFGTFRELLTNKRFDK